MKNKLGLAKSLKTDIKVQLHSTSWVEMKDNNVNQIISKVSAEECHNSSNMMNVKLLDEIISDSEAAEDDQEISMDEEENFLVVDENSETSLTSVND